MTLGMTPGLTLDEISSQLQSRLPGCQVELVANGSPSAQNSLLIDRRYGLEAARLLRDELQLDYCSNATAVDWPQYLEMVYHLFSIEKKEGPLVIRLRTANRSDDVTLPSLTPIWRSAEFQEREAFDLYGIVFTGHPDLRRILMWEGYTDHPMRKDYVPPPEDEP
jgi:NADH-quinone oxidoreductase subunit C